MELFHPIYNDRLGAHLVQYAHMLHEAGIFTYTFTIDLVKF